MEIVEEARYVEKADSDNSVDEFMAGISERSEQSLIPLKEDLAEWIKRLLRVEISQENFLDDLDNGVLVCRIAQAVQKAAEARLQSGKTDHTQPLPSFNMKYHQTAKAGTFFARDNASHFLEWCKEIGVQKSVMFESDGLVLQKQPRNVILCLLDVARIASRYGIEPPGLVKLENEIDEEIRCEEEKKEPSKPAKKDKKPPKPNLNLNEEVFRLAAKYGVRIERIQEGRYIVDGKINIFVRILRNHIMVRVGGGWDTLDHFLSRHDPNRVGKILTSTPQACPHHHGRGN